VPHQKQIGRLQGHVGRVAGLVLSPDARTLISSAYDGSIHLWDLPAKVRPPAKVVLPVRIGVYGSVFTADSRRLITASRTEPITVWEVGTTNALEQISTLGTNNQSVALSPDDGLLAVGGCDGTIKVWDLKNQRLVKQWRPYGPFPVLVTEFLDGGKSLLSGAMPPGWLIEFRRWKVGSWKELSFGSMDLETCFGLTQSPDQQFFATTYESRPVKIWEAASGRLKATLGFLGGFTPVFSPDGHLVAAALRDAGTQVWEVGSGRRVAVLQELAAPTQSAAFSPDGKRVAAGSWGMREATLTVHIWDYLVERELLSLDSQDRSTGCIQFSPDGNTLLAVSWHGLAELWRAPSWAEIEAAEKGQGVP
jgi:WD40 repeat protein